MPPLDAFLAPLLMALAATAVLLGIAAKVLAVRLLLDLDRAANDPVYRRRRAAQRAKTALYAVR